MTQQTKKLWTRLQQEGIVTSDPPEQMSSSASPWYVKALLAFSGWLAALFILGFLAAGFEFIFRNNSVAALLGIAMIAGAFAMLRVPANEFVEHLGLATSMAGQALLIHAIFEFTRHNDGLAWLQMTILQALLVAVMPNFVHRVVSAFVTALALSMTFEAFHIPYLAGGVVMLGASLCWLHEYRFPQKLATIRAIGYGLTLALVTLKGAALFGYKAVGEWAVRKHGLLAQSWSGEIIIGMVTIYIVWSLLQSYRRQSGQQEKQAAKASGRQSMLTGAALLATFLLCAVSVKVQGITVGMVIISLGFWSANRVLLGLGIISLLLYISSYYYLLETTLLIKSGVLLATGITLLALRLLLQRLFPGNEAINDEAHHA